MTRFDFQNSRGETLAGRLESPAVVPRAFAIFAHCFTCSKNVHAAARVARELAQHGIAVLRFDFTGLGNSEGDFANSNFSSNVGDLIAAAAALRERAAAPGLLVGHSLGGAAVLMAAKEIPEVKAVATIAAPSEPAHVSHLFGDTVAAIEEDGAALIHLGGRELRIEKQFLEDLKANRLANSLPSLGKPLLLFHSPADTVVSIEHARKLYQAARHPKNFISIDGADHMLSEKADASFVATTLAAWASRYLGDAHGQATPATDSQVVEVTAQAGALAQTIRAGKHVLVADEPPSVGGSDAGPTPHDLLLASLGACTSMTLQMYANRKRWPVDGIAIRLKHRRIHASDCESCEARDGYIDCIEKDIVVSGDLDDAQIKRLAEIADRCPVHRTLQGKKEITTQIRKSQSG
jgi:putative redox protein